MPDNQKNQSNAPSISSNGPIDNVQEGLSKMKIEKKEEEEVEESNEYPDRPGEPDCGYYLRSGKCGYGTNCRFNHPPNLNSKNAQDGSELPQRENEPDCGYYMKTGTCKYGSSCKFHHPLDRRGAEQVLLNSLGLPIRRDEKPCPYYMRTYTCKFGPACKFDHPQPAPLDATLTIPTGATGSTLPSTGYPYVGALPAWPPPKSSYAASSYVPGSQTYMPYVLPPFQSPLNAQGWNHYMGNLSSISASDTMVPNFVYNSNSQGELATGGTVDLSQAISNLPQRPDQPECRYFMGTGSCKYGSNCKFHHPKERVAHNLGPHGLPFRPGQDLCGYFNSYGVCKYGPTCKFDHPMYVPSYYLGMPHIPMDLPLFPNRRNIVISNSTEASQSKSLKITEWIQKPDTGSDKKKQNSAQKTVEVPCEEVHDDNAAAAAATATVAAPTSELPQDPAD